AYWHPQLPRPCLAFDRESGHTQRAISERYGDGEPARRFFARLWAGPDSGWHVSQAVWLPPRAGRSAAGMVGGADGDVAGAVEWNLSGTSRHARPGRVALFPGIARR